MSEAINSEKYDKNARVYSIVRASRCFNCDLKLEPGSIVQLLKQDDEKEVRCAQCAGLEDLEMLRSGNIKLTNYVKKHSTQLYIVMRWSELWKTYERIGLLAPKDVIDKAKSELKK